MSSTPARELPQFEDFHCELEQRQAQGPIVAELDAVTAFTVLANLQLALRHPQNTGAGAELVRRFADLLARALGPAPALARVIAAGWDPLCGEERE